MEAVAATVLERTGRAVASGGKAVARGGRFVGVQLRRGADAVLHFTSSAGAGESGLARLLHLQFLTAAGDATVAVSLAGTLFFALPTDQARPQVAQFLLLTMAPFAIVAPFIGPFLDRFRHGRRWALGISLALRGFLCWVLAGTLNGSKWLFLCALSFLVASKGLYHHSRCCGATAAAAQFHAGEREFANLHGQCRRRRNRRGDRGRHRIIRPGVVASVWLCDLRCRNSACDLAIASR
jgi:hypothetical protein